MWYNIPYNLYNIDIFYKLYGILYHIQKIRQDNRKRAFCICRKA